MPVEHPRAERADHEVRPLERLVHGRRHVHASGDRLEVVDVERVRIDVPVPGGDVERVIVQAVALVAGADAHDELVVARLLVTDQLGRAVEVTLGERRVLEQLAVAVAVPVRGLELPGRVERQPQLLAGRRQDPVRGAARDHDVVVLAVGEGAERRLELPRAAVHEDQLVSFTISIEELLLGVRAADRDLDIVVVHHDLAPEHRVAAAGRLRRVQQPVGICVGDPLVARDRRERAQLVHLARTSAGGRGSTRCRENPS